MSSRISGLITTCIGRAGAWLDVLPRKDRFTASTGPESSSSITVGGLARMARPADLGNVPARSLEGQLQWQHISQR